MPLKLPGVNGTKKIGIPCFRLPSLETRSYLELVLTDSKWTQLSILICYVVILIHPRQALRRRPEHKMDGELHTLLLFVDKIPIRRGTKDCNPNRARTH